MGAEMETREKMRCLLKSGFGGGTPCLMEKAWICFNLDWEEPHNCKREMHFLRMKER